MAAASRVGGAAELAVAPRHLGITLQVSDLPPLTRPNVKRIVRGRWFTVGAVLRDQGFLGSSTRPWLSRQAQVSGSGAASMNWAMPMPSIHHPEHLPVRDQPLAVQHLARRVIVDAQTPGRTP